MQIVRFRCSKNIGCAILALHADDAETFPLIRKTGFCRYKVYMRNNASPMLGKIIRLKCSANIYSAIKVLDSYGRKTRPLI